MLRLSPACREFAVFAVFAAASLAQTGQPPVVPAPGDVVVRFDLVGVTSPAGNLTGFFTYDFTHPGWVTVEIHFQGSAASYGNPLSDPVHISTTGISGSHDSQTTSYDFNLPLLTALTPNSGALIAVDPPGTPASQLNAWYSIDNGTTAPVFPITGGAILPTWIDMGFAKAGGSATPRCTATGAMTSASTNQIALTAAAPNSVCVLGVGLTPQSLPLFGGTLALDPILTIALPTTATGAATWTFVRPPALPVGARVYFQYWVLDPVASYGLSASNGLSGRAN